MCHAVSDPLRNRVRQSLRVKRNEPGSEDSLLPADLRQKIEMETGAMKMRMAQGTAITAVAMLLAACIDMTSPSSTDSMLALSQAFVTLPAGFSLTNNSFAGDGTTGGAFMPRMEGGGRGRGGPMDDVSGHGGMGGGFGLDFSGGTGFGRGFGRGPFGGEGLRGNCSFSSSSGLVSCTDTREGLTVVSTASYKTAGGIAQAAPDSTTNVATTSVRSERGSLLFSPTPVRSGRRINPF